MKSENFEFLRDKWPELASLGGFAEQYAWPDPAGALVKLRAYISRNTFRIFDCNDQTPTAYYALDQAVEEGYLVPYEVYSHTTQFLRKGIKYKDLTEDQKRQLEEDGEDPKDFEFENHRLESVRTQLRGIMKYVAKETYTTPSPKFIDIRDGQEEYKRLPARLKFSDMPGFRNQVQEALMKVFDENPILHKIRSGSPVSGNDLKALTSLVLTQNPNVDQEVLREFFEQTAEPLDQAIRSIIGMDAGVVNYRFSEFITRHSSLTSNQVSFLNLLKNHISRYGAIEIDDLYEPPFTTLHSDGLDGVFSDERMVEELLAIVDSFKPEPAAKKDQGL